MLHSTLRIGPPATALVLAGAMLVAPTAEAQLTGIDVSHYQATVNWASVKGAGYTFGIAKATEGTSTADATFAANWKAMKAAGIVPGAYHFGRPGSDAATQAKFFVDTVKAAEGGLSGGLQLVLDLEEADGQTPAQVKAWVKTFVSEIQSLTGKPAIIYTNASFWRDKAGDSTDNYNCPLWLAHYGTSPGTIPKAWTTYTFWQHSKTGTVAGVNGNVDLDEFHGNATTLDKFRFP